MGASVYNKVSEGLKILVGTDDLQHKEPGNDLRRKASVKVSLHFIPQVMLLAALMLSSAMPSPAQAKPEGPKSEAPRAAELPAPPKNPDGVGAAVDPNKYLIGPEDVLFIRTWREPDFTFPAGVRPDGKITVPLINDMQAAGLTPMQLTADLKEKLGKYLNNPDVTIFVTDVRSKKYYMDGDFGRTGMFPLVTPIRVLEAISIAGGFKEFANAKKVTILRGDKVFHYNHLEVTKGKRPEQNIYLENGDHVQVK